MILLYLFKDKEHLFQTLSPIPSVSFSNLYHTASLFCPSRPNLPMVLSSPVSWKPMAPSRETIHPVHGHADPPTTDKYGLNYCFIFNWQHRLFCRCVKTDFGGGFFSSALIYFFILWSSGSTTASSATHRTFQHSANHHVPKFEWFKHHPAAYRQTTVAAFSQQSVIWGLQQWGKNRQGWECTAAVVVHVEGEFLFLSLLLLQHWVMSTEMTDVPVVNTVCISFTLDAQSALEIMRVSPAHMVLHYSWSCVLYRFHGAGYFPRRPQGIHTSTHTHLPNPVCIVVEALPDIILVFCIPWKPHSKAVVHPGRPQSSCKENV